MDYKKKIQEKLIKETSKAYNEKINLIKEKINREIDSLLDRNNISNSDNKSLALWGYLVSFDGKTGAFLFGNPPKYDDDRPIRLVKFIDEKPENWKRFYENLIKRVKK